MLVADDGKEPRLRVKAASIACSLGPSRAGAEHTETGLNAACMATRNVLLCALFLLTCKSSEEDASVFAFLETRYTCSKPDTVITHTV